ncbi:cytochrome P450 [Mycena leptocephala]|nr:cytochrome P450 [Mycena leptocephala]
MPKLAGHMLQLLLSPRYGDYEFDWQKLYGTVYRLKGCLGQDRLMVSDPLALQYIINSPNFERGPVTDNLGAILFGDKSVIIVKGMFPFPLLDGTSVLMLVVALGNEHRRLRSALNPAFTAAAVRNYQPVFKKVAEMIAEQFEASPSAVTDICPVLSTATLGAVSEAILGHPLQDLGEDFVTNNIQVVSLSASTSKSQILGDAILTSLPPWLWQAAKHLPITVFGTLRKGQDLANKIGGRIVREKVDAAKQGEINNDLFSLLLHPDASGKAKKELSEDDVVAQTCIILIAGQANSLGFGLMELAKNLEFQDKLRAEIHSALGAGIKNVAYDSMPLLNGFIKETLRLYPAMPLMDRVAVKDSIIPLGQSITTSTGVLINQIPVLKGQLVSVAAASYQRLDPHWGKDTHKFDPSRWLAGTPYQGETVSPLNFFGGPRICLGWRFAILEMQIIFCELISKFEFTQPDSGLDIRPRFMNSLMPTVPNGDKALPIRITRIL